MAHRLASANGGRSCAVKEYLATLDDAAFGAASEVTPKFVSPSDLLPNGPARCEDRRPN
jgi:hypothetical protein